METSHIMDAPRNWPAPNSFYLAFIHLDPISSDYIPQKSDLISKEGTLLEIPIQYLLFQNLNNLREII